jgi:hypothetical protein
LALSSLQEPLLRNEEAFQNQDEFTSLVAAMIKEYVVDYSFAPHGAKAHVVLAVLVHLQVLTNSKHTGA